MPVHPDQPDDRVTEFERQFKKRLAKSHHDADERNLKYSIALDELDRFEDAVVLDLVNSALLWIMASVTEHGKVDHFESYFYDHVEWMYANTDYAIERMDPVVREAIYESAISRRNARLPLYNQYHRECYQRYEDLHKDDPIATFCKGLLLVAGSQVVLYLPRSHVIDLIERCLVLCIDIELMKKGYASPPAELAIDDKVIQDRAEVRNVLDALIKFMLSELDKGELVFVDGKLVPTDGGIYDDDLDDE